MSVPDAPLRHDFAEVNGVRLHYASAGGGPLMLFLHGFPEFWYAWKPQLAEFSRDHTAVAPDMRGYNLSSKPAAVDDYALPLLVEDVRALARHLGYERLVVVGHDWGGLVAWALAIAHPEMVERLVIVNAPHPALFRRELATNPAQQRASQYMLLFRSPQAERTLTRNNFEYLDRILPARLVAAGIFNEDDRRAYHEAWAQPGAITGGLNYYRAARLGPPIPGGAAEVWPGLPADDALMVHCETLVIWGERDTALLPNLDGLERFVPRLRVRRIPGASHWVNHEQAATLNRLIREFL